VSSVSSTTFQLTLFSAVLNLTSLALGNFLLEINLLGVLTLRLQESVKITGKWSEIRDVIMLMS